MNKIVDTVVVGAGVGGLAAARALAAGGQDVVVLEARDRVGGRLHSLMHGEAGVDLGATWFWANEPRITRLIAELETTRQTRPGASTRHPLFGDLTFEEAGWLYYKHLDHHLTQFGV